MDAPSQSQNIWPTICPIFRICMDWNWHNCHQRDQTNFIQQPIRRIQSTSQILRGTQGVLRRRRRKDWRSQRDKKHLKTMAHRINWPGLMVTWEIRNPAGFWHGSSPYMHSWVALCPCGNLNGESWNYPRFFCLLMVFLSPAGLPCPALMSWYAPSHIVSYYVLLSDILGWPSLFWVDGGS